MDLLEFLPRLCWPFGDDLAVLSYRFEETEQMPPFPAFKENRVFRKGAREDLFVFNPAEIRAIEVTVGHLKFRAIARLSCCGARARNLLMGNHFSEEFPATL